MIEDISVTATSYAPSIESTATAAVPTRWLKITIMDSSPLDSRPTDSAIVLIEISFEPYSICCAPSNESTPASASDMVASTAASGMAQRMPPPETMSTRCSACHAGTLTVTRVPSPGQVSN